MSRAEAYEVRFGLTRRDLWLIPVAVLFTAVCVLLVMSEGAGIAVVGIVGFGLFLALRVVQLVSRRVALRVDEAGITLGLTPPWPRRHTVRVPWREIAAVVLWRQQTGYSSLRHLGLVRPVGLPPLPGSMRNRFLRRVALAFIPSHVPPQVAIYSRAVAGWSVNRDRLAAAVARFAPQVEVDDRW